MKVIKYFGIGLATTALVVAPIAVNTLGANAAENNAKYGGTAEFGITVLPDELCGVRVAWDNPVDERVKNLEIYYFTLDADTKDVSGMRRSSGLDISEPSVRSPEFSGEAGDRYVRVFQSASYPTPGADEGTYRDYLVNGVEVCEQSTNTASVDPSATVTATSSSTTSSSATATSTVTQSTDSAVTGNPTSPPLVGESSKPEYSGGLAKTGA